MTPPALAPAPAAGPVTHARVLRIAVPIVVSNVTVPLLGIVDTGVVGQLGQAAPIGAVGLGAVTLATVYWMFGFLRMGTSGLAAQARGAGDGVEGTAILLRALLVGLAAGAAFTLLQVPITEAALRLSPASPEVDSLLRQYLGVRFWGAPATIALYAVTGWLIAQERTRAVLVLQVWMNGLNLCLTLWFVLGMGRGVPGVAAATLIAEWAGLAFGLWLCRASFGAALAPAWARVRDGAALRRMGAVNGNLMLRSVILQGSFTTFLFLGAGLGDVTLAANQVLMQFLEITAYALDGIAFAAEALVGLAIGARRPADLGASVRITAQWGAAGALALALAFALVGPAIIDLIARAPEVRAEARAYLPWMVAAPVVGIAAWMLDGIFIGATLTREMRQSMLLSVMVYAAALAVLVPAFGNHGLWAALMVLNAARGVTLGALWPRVARAAGA